MGPLRPEAVATVRAFLRCGDLAAGFTRFHCPECGAEKLLAFTCKSRHFCPACHQRRVRQTGAWIADSVCHDVPHRQFVFTFPKMLRGIFRKRRHLLHLLFQTAAECLRDALRARLQLPHGRIAAAAAVHTFGDYLVFHPHLHLFAADGLFDEEGRFHSMPPESLGLITELFRHRFLHVLRESKLLSAHKAAELLSWKHSGFHIDGGEKPVAPGDAKGRQRLAEYLLRAPFSLQKIHWNAETKTVIYRSRRSWRTKRNFEVFTAADFIAAAIDHIPPKGQQTIRYYGLYSNKSRGLPRPATAPAEPIGDKPPAPKPPIVPPPPKATARAMRPLWRDLILRVWGADPLQCPCCHAIMNVVDAFFRPGEIEFFLRLHGLWESVIDIPPPPDPPFDIETFEPIEPPWQAIREWIPADDDDPTADLFDQRPKSGQPVEIPLEDGYILVLDGD
jgi:transposase-like protein